MVRRLSFNELLRKLVRDIISISMGATRVLKHIHLRIDPRKLEGARRLLGAATDTETIDRALTLVVTEGEIDATLRRFRGKAKLRKAFR